MSTRHVYVHVGCSCSREHAFFLCLVVEVPTDLRLYLRPDAPSAVLTKVMPSIQSTFVASLLYPSRLANHSKSKRPAHRRPHNVALSAASPHAPTVSYDAVRQLALARAFGPPSRSLAVGRVQDPGQSVGYIEARRAFPLPLLSGRVYRPVPCVAPPHLGSRAFPRVEWEPLPSWGLPRSGTWARESQWSCHRCRVPLRVRHDGLVQIVGDVLQSVAALDAQTALLASSRACNEALDVGDKVAG